MASLGESLQQAELSEIIGILEIKKKSSFELEVFFTITEGSSQTVENSLGQVISRNSLL